MTPPAYLLALTTILAVSAIGASLFAVWRSHALAVVADERARAGLERCQAAVAALEKKVSALTAELRTLEHAAGASPAAPRSSLNLSTRSQALRMHRQGEPRDRIAAALAVPLQEVDLLIKVHRIVISSR